MQYKNLGQKFPSSNTIDFFLLSTIFMSIILFGIGLANNIDPFLRLPISIYELKSIVDYRAVDIILIVGYFLSLLFVSHFFKLNVFASNVILIVFIITIFNQIYSALICLLILSSSFSFGKILVSFAGFKEADVDDLDPVIVLVLGVGSLGTITYAFNFFPINYPGMYGLGLCTLIFFNKKYLISLYQRKNIFFYKNEGGSTLFSYLISILVTYYVLMALMPEIGHDAQVVHMFYPGFIASNHYWPFDSSKYIFGTFPLLANSIFTIPYLLGGEVAVRLLNTSCLLLLMHFIRALTIWAGGGEKGGQFAVLLYLTSSLTLLVGSSLYVDVIWATFLIGASFLIFKAIFSNIYDAKILLLTSLLLSFSLATKALTLLYLPMVSVFLIIYIFKHYRSFRAKDFLWLFLIIIIIGGAPYWVAYFKTGNPIFPFYNKLFQSPFFNIDTNFIDGRWIQNLSINLINDITFKSGLFIEGRSGAPGFQWILLLPSCLLICLIVLNKRALVIFLAALVSLCTVFLSTPYLRYIFPVFIWLDIVIGIGAYALIKDFRGNKFRNYLFLGLCSSAIVLNLYFIKSATYYSNLDFKALISNANRIKYLSVNAPIKVSIDILNLMNVRKAPVAIFSSSPLVAGLNTDYYSSSWYSYKFDKDLRKVNNGGELLELLQSRKIDLILVEKNWANEKVNEGLVQMLNEIANEVHANDGGAIYRIKNIYRYSKELLPSNYVSKEHGWNFPGTDNSSNLIFYATEKNPASIQVHVDPGEIYLSSIGVVCKDGNSLARNQINWHDKNHAYLSTSIQVFPCGNDYSENKAEVTSPSGANYAVVYATSNSNFPVGVKFISFKN